MEVGKGRDAYCGLGLKSVPLQSFRSSRRRPHQGSDKGTEWSGNILLQYSSVFLRRLLLIRAGYVWHFGESS